jgi:hypothetical protein
MITLVKKGGGKQRIKYIKVKQELEIQYIKMHDMLADILTKGLGREQLHTLAEAILVIFEQRGCEEKYRMTCLPLG